MLIPDWPAPPGVHALCSTRAGGVSHAPFDSLNLGDHVGDKAAAVACNRDRWQQMLQARSAGARVRPVFLQQVHGQQVVCLTPETPEGTQADACVSATAGLACTIMVADCLPVLLAHRELAIVAGAHAGWRGLAGQEGWGVLEAVFEQFSALAQLQQAHAAIESIAKNTLAWLGPCIGAAAFEVGAEVHAAFCQTQPEAALHFQALDAGRYRADLAALARLRLARLGITAVYGNDSSPAWCTVHHSAQFFSHRRDTVLHGGSGRMAASVWCT